MSGYNHGSVPWLENPDNTGRQCPWISTEIWAGWYNSYGQTDYSYLRIVRCNDYLLARGAGGLNYYMVHGGTNFDSWNDDENPASYDYAAAIGESGGTPPQLLHREGEIISSRPTLPTSSATPPTLCPTTLITPKTR